VGEGGVEAKNSTWAAQVTDAYRNFQELQAHEVEGEDWVREYHPRGTRILVMAPHGGEIEAFTTELAREIAGEEFSFYCFEGLKPRGNKALHLTSHRFDEPLASRAVSEAGAVLAIHGERSLEGAFIMVGGLWGRLKDDLSPALNRTGFELRDPRPGLTGENPGNICNRGRLGKGGQLELSGGLRGSLRGDSGRRKLFTSAVGEVLRALELDLSDAERGVGGPSPPGAEDGEYHGG
jgi:phage replication-related protein YjqB (UPF0714/DUF867 family)